MDAEEEMTMPDWSSPSDPPIEMGIIISNPFLISDEPAMAEMPRSGRLSPLEWLFPGWKAARGAIETLISGMGDLLEVSAALEPGTFRVAPSVPASWEDGWPPGWVNLVDIDHRIRVATIVNGCIRAYLPSDLDRKLAVFDENAVARANILVQEHQRHLLACGNPSFRSTLSSRLGVPRFDKR